MPQARDWVVLDAAGQPRTYGSATYRYYWNCNHPDAEAFYRQLVRFAVHEIHTDLVHFDNYVVGPGYDSCSVSHFRRFLRDTFTATQLADMGAADVDAIRPPGPGAPELLVRAWNEFCSRSLADSYHSLSRYARSLRPEILVECNPGGMRGSLHAPLDHGRLLQGGEAFSANRDPTPTPAIASGWRRQR